MNDNYSLEAQTQRVLPGVFGAPGRELGRYRLAPGQLGPRAPRWVNLLVPLLGSAFSWLE